MNFKVGDVVVVTSLPKKWASAHKLGETYTICEVGYVKAVKHVVVRTENTYGWVKPECLSHKSKLHKVLR